MSQLLRFDKFLSICLVSVLCISSPAALYAENTPPQALPATATAGASPRNFAPFAPKTRISQQVLTEDTFWQGTVLVEGMVTVAAQATLTIMPGTVVRFGADSGILVLGRIVAKGSENSPIILASKYEESAQSDWYGVVLTGTAKKNIFERVKMDGAKVAIYARSSSLEVKKLQVNSSSVALKLADTIVSLNNISVSACSTGLSSVKSEIDLEATVFENCDTALSLVSSSLTATGLTVKASSQAALIAEKSHLGIEQALFAENQAGAMFIGCEGAVSSSKFTKNYDAAVVFSGSPLRFTANLVTGNKIGIQLLDNLASIWGNSIHANSSYNLLYLGEDILYAGGNWFNTGNPELLLKTLFAKRPGIMQILPLLDADPLNKPPKG